jgi:hypothetical protein
MDANLNLEDKVVLKGWILIETDMRDIGKMLLL